MEKHNAWRKLGSYSIDYPLIKRLEAFISTRIPQLLQLDWHVASLADQCALTLAGSKEGIVFSPMRAYTETLFKNDIQILRIELQYADRNSPPPITGIVLLLRLGRASDDSELSIALRADHAKEKSNAIEEGLLAVLEPNKNRNSAVYPNEFMPTLVFVVGFFMGVGALMFTMPVIKAAFIVLFGLSAYYVARRFTKGYCSFHSRRQQQLDRFLAWFTVFLIASLLTCLFLIFR